MSANFFGHLLLLFVCVQSSLAFSQGKKARANMESPILSETSGPAHKSMLLATPLLSNEASLHVEWNLSGEAGVGIYGGIIGQSEYFSSSAVEKGNSLKAKGTQGVLVLSRYSEPMALAGWFWTLGVGYRSLDVDWMENVGKTRTAKSIFLDGNFVDHHEVRGSGAMGLGRVGYRWVASSWPFALGGYLGMTHFQGEFRDKNANVAADATLATSSKERKSLAHIFMTRPELALEIGAAF